MLPERAMTAASSAICRVAYGPGGASDLLAPRLSEVITRKRAASLGRPGAFLLGEDRYPAIVNPLEVNERFFERIYADG